MQTIYNLHKSRYIAIYGVEKFDTLYKKVNNSKQLFEITGYTINTGLPPTSLDFLNNICLMPYLIFKFHINHTVMASLIALKIWDTTVNTNQQTVSEERLKSMAEMIAARWI